MASNPNISKSKRLSQNAKDSIAELVALTRNGMLDSAAELHSVGVFAVSMLTWLCEKQPERFTDIAQEHSSWPVIYDPHPEKVRENTEFLQKLKLAAKTQINFSSGKTFSWQVPANVVALQLFQLAKSLRRVPMRYWTTHDLQSLVA